MLVASLAGCLALCITMPLAWKWALGVRRVAIATVGLALVSTLAVVVLNPAGGLLQAGLIAALTVGSAFGILAHRFYRDPERGLPGRTGRHRDQLS